MSQAPRPLAQLQRATERIARGEPGVRLLEGRHGEFGHLMRHASPMAAGLGLAICEAIARAHGGHIQAQAQASPLGGQQVLRRLPRQAGIPNA